jgi:hypothetical protein
LFAVRPIATDEGEEESFRPRVTSGVAREDHNGHDEDGAQRSVQQNRGKRSLAGSAGGRHGPLLRTLAASARRRAIGMSIDLDARVRALSDRTYGQTVVAFDFR